MKIFGRGESSPDSTTPQEKTNQAMEIYRRLVADGSAKNIIEMKNADQGLEQLKQEVWDAVAEELGKSGSEPTQDDKTRFFSSLDYAREKRQVGFDA